MGLPKRKNRSQIKGVILIICLLTSVILSILGFYFLYTSQSSYKTTNAYLFAATSLYLCGAGLDEALFLIKHNESVFPLTTGQFGGTNNTPIGGNLNLVQGQEHVLIHNMAYTNNGSSGDFLGAHLVGTFTAQQTGCTSCTGGSGTLFIQAIGFIKQAPNGYDPTKPDYCGGICTGDTTKALADWTVIGKRNCFETITFTSATSQVTKWYEQYHGGDSQ